MNIPNENIYEAHKVRDIYYELEDLFANLNFDVVIVEDDVTTTEFIKAVGYATNDTSRIRSFSDAKSAFEHIEGLDGDKKPDLVIIDIHLKGELDGYWLCDKIQRHYPEIRLVMISSDNPVLVKKRMSRTNLQVQFIKKPFTIHEMAELFE